MCGIFGVVAFNRSGLSASIAAALIDSLTLLAESRGMEASGVAVLAGDYIEFFKRPVAPRKLVHMQPYREIRSKFTSPSCVQSEKSARCMLGHARMATNGPCDTHGNNQPVIKHGILCVHNGIIVNDRELWESLPSYTRELTLDTEVLLSHLDSNLKKGAQLSVATIRLYKELQGAATCAFLFSEVNALLLATNVGSLHIHFNESAGVLVFCSERGMLTSLSKKAKFQLIFAAGTTFKVNPGKAWIVDLGTSAIDEVSLSDKKENLACSISSSEPRAIRELFPPQQEDTLHVSNPSVSTTDRARLAGAIESAYQLSLARWSALKKCTRCLLPATFPFISYGGDGVCSYCSAYEPIVLKGRNVLGEVVESARKANGQSDCLVGLSGGRDSCYALHFLTKELGLHPVAFTYDWGMITDLARRNISRMCSSLGVEHILVSANIPRKRAYIKKNVTAWLECPSLGLIPLFMAGDKPYFYHAQRLKAELGLPLVFQAENLLEKTLFKQGFAGVQSRKKDPLHVYTLDVASKLKMLYYYGSNFLLNPSLLNASLCDTAYGFFSYYLLKPEYLNLFNYIQWDEDEIVGTLRADYNWEVATDTKTTWRIGDGTAAFYNWIYFETVGFTEIDCFRSNQIREGALSRDAAAALVAQENVPRVESILWYCETNKIDPIKVVNTICSSKVREYNRVGGL